MVEEGEVLHDGGGVPASGMPTSLHLARFEQAVKTAAQRLVMRDGEVDAAGYDRQDYESLLRVRAWKALAQAWRKGLDGDAADLYVFGAIWRGKQGAARYLGSHQRRARLVSLVVRESPSPSPHGQVEAQRLLRRLEQALSRSDLELLCDVLQADGGAAEVWRQRGGDGVQCRTFQARVQCLRDLAREFLLQ